MTNFLPLFGRIFIAMIFLIAGVNKIIDFPGTVGYISNEGLPYAHVLAALAATFEIGGSLLVLLGYKVRFGAFILFLFCIPATFLFHDFWTLEPAAAMSHMQHFMKNFAMMGGLLYVMALGGGGISFDEARA